MRSLINIGFVFWATAPDLFFIRIAKPDGDGVSSFVALDFHFWHKYMNRAQGKNGRGA